MGDPAPRVRKTQASSYEIPDTSKKGKSTHQGVCLANKQRHHKGGGVRIKDTT